MFVKEAKYYKMSGIGINFVPLIPDIEQRFGYYIKSHIGLSKQTVITFFDIRHRFCKCHIYCNHSAYPDLGGEYLTWVLQRLSCPGLGARLILTLSMSWETPTKVCPDLGIVQCPSSPAVNCLSLDQVCLCETVHHKIIKRKNGK